MPTVIKPSGTSGAASVTGCMALSDNVPKVTRAELEGLLERSTEARHLKRDFDGKLASGRCMSRREVLDLVGSEPRGDARPRDHKHARARRDHAILVAYYAQNHAQVFAADAQPEIFRFLHAQDWPELMAELHAFIAELNRQADEARKAEEAKQERLKDDIKHDDAKRALIKENGTRADRQRDLRKLEATKAEQKAHLKVASPADVDEELTGSGKVPLSDVELAKLGLLKKGFANND